VPLLTDELKAWIGREAHYPAREELGRAAIRYFALAMGDANPLYVDEAYAKEAGYPSVIAPPTLICETCQYAHRAPDADGYIGHVWHLPVANCRLLRAGNEYEFVRPILPSDWISVMWTLEDIVERSASRGGAQLFVTSVARYRDAEGEVVAINRETLVYQPLGPA
jgi:acyl dehydratase